MSRSQRGKAGQARSHGAAHRALRRRLLVAAAAAAAVLAVIGVVVVVAVRGADGGADGTDAVAAIAGVRTYSHSNDHVEEPVDYAQSPPAGGPHNPVWLNCGVYPRPVRDENAVHSMEHGAVWITYRPDLSVDEISTLRDLVSGQPYLILSPYPGLPSAVVISAWDTQLRLASADDPRLLAFIGEYRQGPQTPEPGAPCTGGTGAPQ